MTLMLKKQDCFSLHLFKVIIKEHCNNIITYAHDKLTKEIM